MERQRRSGGATGGEEQLTAAAADLPLMGQSQRPWEPAYERWYKGRHSQMEPPAVTPKSFGAYEVSVGYNFGPEQAAHLLEAVKAVSDRVGGMTLEVASASSAKRITASTRPTDLMEKASPFTKGVKVIVNAEGIDDQERRAIAAWVIANTLGDSRIDRGLGGPAADVGRRSPELGEMLGKLA